MEESRCAFARYRASCCYSRGPGVHLGLHSINLGCAWTGMARRNGCDKSGSTKKQSLSACETGHLTSPLEED
jgi:hypothetical protein